MQHPKYVFGKRVISLLRISDEDEGSGLVAHWLLQCVQQNGFLFHHSLAAARKRKSEMRAHATGRVDATRFTFNMS
jgi:hypothetical protein